VKPVRRRRLGRTGIEVGELALGGAGALMNQHGAVDDAEAVAIVSRALALGVDLIDTSPAYGARLSERRIGMATRDRPGVRLCTKTGLFDEGSGYRVDFSRDATRRSLEESLSALGRDCIDLVQLHEVTGESWADVTGRKGALAALEAARDEGIVRWIGVTGSEPGILVRAVETGRFDTVMIWRVWNLLDRSGEPVLEAAQAAGAGVLIGSPLASGILATGAVPGALLHYRTASDEELEIVRAHEAEARRRGESLLERAMRFCLDPRVACVVAGVTRAEQVDELAAAVCG
jgi:aryl-alcohol dehydrogenase-like predicted oxidoreductase